MKKTRLVNKHQRIVRVPINKNSKLKPFRTTASKHAIALIHAEMERKDFENAKKYLLNAGELAKNDAEMNEIKIQMAEMAKIINSIQQPPTDTLPNHGVYSSQARGKWQIS